MLPQHPFPKADTVTWQERPVTLYEMLGKCSRTTGQKVKGLLFFSRLRTGKGWQVLLCQVHIFVFLWSTERLQEGRSSLRRAAGSLAEQAAGLATVTTLQAPSALLPRLQHGTRFSVVQGAEEAFLPSSMPSQPTYFFHSCCSAPRAHPFEITNYPPLPSCSSLAMAWFPTQITS